jgi:hypothetical protein
VYTGLHSTTACCSFPSYTLIAHYCLSHHSSDVLLVLWFRQGAWQHTYPFSPVYAAKYAQDPPSNYTYRSASFGGPLIFQQRLQTFTADGVATAAAMVHEYKRWRDALWQDPRVTVHHLMAPAWGPDLFPGPPLTSAAVSDPYTGGAGFDAIQAVSGDQKTSALFVYVDAL